MVDKGNIDSSNKSISEILITENININEEESFLTEFTQKFLSDLCITNNNYAFNVETNLNEMNKNKKSDLKTASKESKKTKIKDLTINQKNNKNVNSKVELHNNQSLSNTCNKYSQICNTYHMPYGPININFNKNYHYYESLPYFNFESVLNNFKENPSNMLLYFQNIDHYELNSLLNCVRPNIFSLLIDYRGYLFFSCLFNIISKKERIDLIKIIFNSNSFYNLISCSYGLKSVISIIKEIKLKDEKEFLFGYIYKSFCSNLDNKYIYLLIEYFQENALKDWLDYYLIFYSNNISKLLSNEKAVSLVQNFIRKSINICDYVYKRNFISKIYSQISKLVNDKLGYKIIICILQSWGVEICLLIVNYLSFNMIKISCGTNSSEVIKFLFDEYKQDTVSVINIYTYFNIDIFKEF